MDTVRSLSDLVKANVSTGFLSSDIGRPNLTICSIMVAAA